jgi:glycosyltransferase involved in cell wall biosynthesis
MVEPQPLLSIVVPTRNRGRYAISMIESILELSGDDFELVVCDNSDDSSVDDWVAHRGNDRRLVYERVNGVLSMTANHNHAFAMASGEFVCLIGDDDTVLASLLDGCRWAHEQKLDALTPDTPIRYCWPDLVHWYWGKRHAGKLYADKWEGRVWDGDPRREAFACMRRAGQGAGWLPKVYHGVVRRSLLEELKTETGAYCFGVSPDVYLAMALARKVCRQACTDIPLTIPGNSGGSNSGRAAKNQHHGDLKNDPHMAAFGDVVWLEGNPKFFSIETVWAQAALEAARRTNWEEMQSAFDFAYLYALCLVRHAEYSHEIRSAVSGRASVPGISTASLWLSIASRIFRILGARGWYYLRRGMRPTPRGYSREYSGYQDIRSASEFVSSAFCDRAPWNRVMVR